LIKRRHSGERKSRARIPKHDGAGRLQKIGYAGLNHCVIDIAHDAELGSR
jgi:hypothetical protein